MVEGLYVDYTVDGGQKIDWAIMMMDKDFVHDMRDSFKTEISAMDKRIDNQCAIIGGESNARIIQKMATKRERLKIMLTLIEKELDEDVNEG